MAENSGFFASVGGDRKYNMDFLARWIASIISNGTYNGELAVTADGSAMTVTLPAGRAWINGYHYRNDGPLMLTIDNADGVLNRKDIVVLRWDVNVRSITAQVIKGSPASSPIAPQITRTVEQYDLKLAEISIPAGTTAITQSLITDTRLDNSVCGIVHGVVDQIDTTTLYNQIQADLAEFRATSETDFTAWFEGIKDILGTDEAGNLLAKINDLAGDGRTTETIKANADAIAAHTARTDNPHGVTAAQAGAFPSNVGAWLPYGTDLHSILITGIWMLNTWLDVSNAPPVGGWGIFISVHGGDGNTIHIILFSTHDIWIESAGANFTAWSRINAASADDANSITSALTVTTSAPSGTLAAGKLWGVY